MKREFLLEVTEVGQTFSCTMELIGNNYIASCPKLHIVARGQTEDEAFDNLYTFLYDELSMDDEDWDDFSLGTPKFRE